MADATPVSQNGWPVFETGTAEGLSVIERVTGRVAEGHVAVVMAWLCDRFHYEVEPVEKGSSWGYAYRPVIGQVTGYSNHASGTAVDLNAPEHPLSATGTFTPEQLVALRRILADAGGVIRWGGDYHSRPDEMHFEIVAGPSAVESLSTRIITLEVPMAVDTVTWGGRTYSRPMRDGVARWSALALAEGIPFWPTQGGFNSGGVLASAGTHDGDAIDLSVYNLSYAQVYRLNEIGRMLGFASWFRTTDVAKWGTRAHGFGSYHIHAVPNGWAYPSAGARLQADAYRRGRDGLASNGVDTGPGHVSIYRTRTFAGYLAALEASQPSPGLPETGVNDPVPVPVPTPVPSEEEELMAVKDEIIEAVKQIVYNERRQMQLTGFDRAGQGMRVLLEEIQAKTINQAITSGGEKTIALAIAQSRNFDEAQSATLAALITQVRAIADQVGVDHFDEQAIIKGVVAELIPTIYDSVVAAMGDISPEFSSATAEKVINGIWMRLEA